MALCSGGVAVPGLSLPWRRGMPSRCGGRVGKLGTSVKEACNESEAFDREGGKECTTQRSQGKKRPIKFLGVYVLVQQKSVIKGKIRGRQI
jgi:hypothetical protein